jgi:glycosyltransferase involved in cell wall biosynthesis
MVTILQHLDRSRFAPQLLLARPGGALLSEVPSDVPVHCCGTVNAGGKLARWRRIRRFAQILAEQQIDLVYDRTYLATLDADVACRWRRTRRLSAAVADPAVQFQMYARQPRWLWRSVSRWAYRSADRVLANSAGLQRQMIQYWNLPAERVVLLPNAIDFDRIERLAREPCPSEQGGRFRILTVGRIDDDKGHADFLSALDELVHRDGQTDLLWQIVGVGPKETALRDDIEARGLTAHVQFAGTVANPFPWYRAADLFVLPSRTEGLPNVLIEALACGTPVIATDCNSGPREILDNGRYGALTPVREPAALAEAVLTARRNPVQAREQAAAGRAAVRTRFDAPAVVRQLEELLMAVMPNQQ